MKLVFLYNYRYILHKNIVLMLEFNKHLLHNKKYDY